MRSLLDLDPEIEQNIDPEYRPLAHRALSVELLELPAGSPVAGSTSQPDDCLLVVDGLLKREVRVAAGRSIEPLGPGDVLRPSQDDAASFLEGQITVLMPARIAILGREFLSRAGRFPGVVDILLERTMRRSRLNAAFAAIHGLVGVDRRLFAVLWTLAERWGEVTNGHVFLPLELRHDELAALVASRRQSVTDAAGRLEGDGAIERTAGGWILRSKPPEMGL